MVEVAYYHGATQVAVARGARRHHADAAAADGLVAYVADYNAKHRLGDALRVSDIRAVERPVP